MDPQQPTQESPAIPPSLPPPKHRIPLFIGILFLSLFILVGSYLIFGTKQSVTPTPPVSQISPTVIPTVDPTTNWKTYAFNDLGYSIKAPSDYTFSVNNLIPTSPNITQSLSFTETSASGGKNDFGVLVFKSSLKSHLEEMLQDNLLKTGTKLINNKEWTIASGPLNETQYLIEVNNFTYVVGAKNIQLLDQILSTFTFLDQNQINPTQGIDETEKWNIHTNTKYNYSVKYPAGWFLYDKGILNPTTNEFSRQQEIVIISPNPTSDLFPGGFSIKNSILIQGNLGAVIKEGISRSTYQVSETKLNQFDAIKTITIGEEIMGDPTTNYYFTKNNINFQISYTNDDFKGTHNPVFDQILSTFIFLE